ncbi:hypothetical protein PV328_006099 [Microctonus aethiopoides]|uniref:Thioredoxin domain-containing protein 3 n=1 Tax=Microctonus aethiopoides TaxID=144406 RepID=A0AA39FNN3_9HYME|nr:hypothetical protein PV328_006099 [Microctonus aethiopoides]
MAKKNAPAALQIEVTTDEEWSKILEKKGLIVVDVYSEWSGPCSGMVSILKKIKMEIGGDLLSYATAKCDNIGDLQRFRGKSEPTWMFIHNGKMVNLMFGAYCPELQKMLTDELQKIQNNEPHDIPVNERSPQEQSRLQFLEEERLAKEASKKAMKEAEAKARYDAEINHLMTSLADETCLILYPWIFKDEEGHRRDKKLSPPYMDLIDNVLPENYIIQQEMKKHLNEELVSAILVEHRREMDVEKYLLNLLFGEPVLPKLTDYQLPEGWYRHKPTPIPFGRENNVFPVVWATPNSMNKIMVFKTIFKKYLEATFPVGEIKYNTMDHYLVLYTRKNELKVVLEMQESEVLHFGIFERDKPPEAKLIAMTITEFDEKIEDKTGFEVFVCVVKKVGSEAFLTFAGIGPYHVSENPETAIEESKLYFQDNTPIDDQSDDEDKPEFSEDNSGEHSKTANEHLQDGK